MLPSTPVRILLRRGPSGRMKVSGRRTERRLRVAVLCLVASACGGSRAVNSPPGAPAALVANAGDGAVSLGWDPPAQGGAVESYRVAVTPAQGSSVTMSGRTALVRGLTNGTPTTFAVTATGAGGTGPARTVDATPQAYVAAGEAALTVAGDTSSSGIFDPSVVGGATTAWLSYSSVNFHLDAANRRVQDVGISLARSDDGGLSWTFVRSVAIPSDTTVTDTTGAVCGAASCTGRWVYETSWLVDDPTDATARYKLFAHQYFLYPPASNSTIYVLGAIVMWTATSPERLGDSPPRTVLRWKLTPPALAGGIDVNGLASDLAGCLAVAEGSGSARPDALDLVLSCTYFVAGANPLPQKVVLLRSTDHAATFRYVSTLLDAPDAAPLQATFFTAPAILAAPDPAPVLLVTPAFSGIYGGCVAIPFADLEAGTLARDGGFPVDLLFVPAGTGQFGGACALDRSLAMGILRNEVDLGAPWPPTFRIIRTGRSL